MKRLFVSLKVVTWIQFLGSIKMVPRRDGFTLGWRISLSEKMLPDFNSVYNRNCVSLNWCSKGNASRYHHTLEENHTSLKLYTKGTLRKVSEFLPRILSFQTTWIARVADIDTVTPSSCLRTKTFSWATERYCSIQLSSLELSCSSLIWVFHSYSGARCVKWN